MVSVAKVARGTGQILSALYYRAVLPVQFKECARKVIGDRSFPTTRLMLQEGLYNGLCLGRTGVKKMIDESYNPMLIRKYNLLRVGAYSILLLSLPDITLCIAGIKEATEPVLSPGLCIIYPTAFTFGLLALSFHRFSIKNYFRHNEIFKGRKTFKINY